MEKVNESLGEKSYKVLETICKAIGIDLQGALTMIEEPFVPKNFKKPSIKDSYDSLKTRRK